MGSGEVLSNSNNQTLADIVNSLAESGQQNESAQPGAYHISDFNRNSAGFDDIAQAPDAVRRLGRFQNEEPEATMVEEDVNTLPIAEPIHEGGGDNNTSAVEAIPLAVGIHLGNPWNTPREVAPNANSNTR